MPVEAARPYHGLLRSEQKIMAVRGKANGGKSLMTVLLMYFLVTEFCFADTPDNRQLVSPENQQSTQESDNIGLGDQHVERENVKTTISDLSAEEDEESVVRKLTEFRERKKKARSVLQQASISPDSELDEERRRYEAAEKAVRDVSIKKQILAQFLDFIVTPCLLSCAKHSKLNFNKILFLCVT